MGYLQFILFIFLFYIIIYKGLTVLNKQIDESWEQINTQIRRRFNLIPNLVEMVKSYDQYDQATLTKVIEAYRLVMQSQSESKQDMIDADNRLTQSLKAFFELSESYPDLKANQSFLSLQCELESTVNIVAYSCQRYNSRAKRYNTGIESIPGKLIANIHKFKKREIVIIPVEELIDSTVQAVIN